MSFTDINLYLFAELLTFADDDPAACMSQTSIHCQPTENKQDMKRGGDNIFELPNVNPYDL